METEEIKMRELQTKKIWRAVRKDWRLYVLLLPW